MCGPMGCERTQANQEKKPKKQIVTEDKSEDANKKVQDSGKEVVND